MTQRIYTVPNIICMFRLAGSFVLAAMALMDESRAFLWFYVFLAMTDWIDGKLAILLDQRTALGARLDSWADAALYTALAFGAVTMHGDALRAEAGYVGAALGVTALSIAAALWKYRRWPSYHTRAAKISWFLIMLGAACLFLDWPLWPMRVAFVGIALTHAEYLLITVISPEWRFDVPTVYHAWRDRGA